MKITEIKKYRGNIPNGQLQNKARCQIIFWYNKKAGLPAI